MKNASRVNFTYILSKYDIKFGLLVEINNTLQYYSLLYVST